MPPPPPPPPILHPPSLSKNEGPRTTGTTARTNLMEEIRNNNLKLNHVETS